MKAHKADAEAGAPLLTFAEAAALPTVSPSALSFFSTLWPASNRTPFGESEDEARARLFKHIPWIQGCVGKVANCIIAGGAVHGELTNNWRYSDIDIFIYGVSASDADALLQKLVPLICEGSDVETTVTGGAVTFTDVSGRSVQVIRLITPTAAAVLQGFDLGASAVGFDLASGRFLFTRLGALAASSGLVPVDVARCSKTFEARLAKYARRGLSIVFPQFSFLSPQYCKLSARIGQKQALRVTRSSSFNPRVLEVRSSQPVASAYEGDENADDSPVSFQMRAHFVERLCNAAEAGGAVDIATLPALVRVYNGALWGCGLGWVRKAVVEKLGCRVKRALAPLSFEELAAGAALLVASAREAEGRAFAAVAELEALPTPPLWTLGGGINFGHVVTTPAEWYGENFNGLDLEAAAD